MLCGPCPGSRATRGRAGGRKAGRAGGAVAAHHTQLSPLQQAVSPAVGKSARHVDVATGVLFTCASSLPLASATSQTTTTKGAKLGGRLGGKRDFAGYRHQGRPDGAAAATKHAAKKAAKKAAKLPAAGQAGVKQSTNTSTLHRQPVGGQWAEAAACWRTDWATVCPQQAATSPCPPHVPPPPPRPSELLPSLCVAPCGSCAGPC